MSAHARAALAALLCSAIGCSHAAEPIERSHVRDEDSRLSGGATTVHDATRDAFSLPAANLGARARTQFFLGNSFFNQNWVSAPATTATRDGLGPLFNARSCSTCHFKDGRGRPPESGEALHTLLLRISVPGRDAHGGPLPDPIYGAQIQSDALPGSAPEAEVIAEYREQPGAFADGEPYSLREPHYRLNALGYGEAASPLLQSPRVAPHMVGLGLLEAVPEASIVELARAAQVDPITGRMNRVWDEAKQTHAFGRFGWKAEQPSVRQQVAGAFLGDMGITSSLFPSEGCTERQRACSEHPSGGTPEVTDDVLDEVVRYSRTLGVPARRDVDAPSVQRGEAAFERARCSACHVPTLLTGAVPDLHELAEQTIHPYTDLLLHDMGDALADDRPAFEADGREWRTPPLWGIGLVHKVNGHTFFMHDGRARNLTEAVLWHGGEAEPAKQRFVRMPRAERTDLIAFLESL